MVWERAPERAPVVRSRRGWCVCEGEEEVEEVVVEEEEGGGRRRERR